MKKLLLARFLAIPMQAEIRLKLKDIFRIERFLCLCEIAFNC